MRLGKVKNKTPDRAKMCLMLPTDPTLVGFHCHSNQGPEKTYHRQKRASESKDHLEYTMDGQIYISGIPHKHSVAPDMW